MNMQNCRTVYGKTLVELGKVNEKIVVLEADLGRSTMTKLFETEFPNRFFEVGIGEQNMISTAAGLAFSGKIPFANSFAVFAAGRTYDQIRVSCIAEANIKVVGSSAGLSDFGDGATHQAIDDLAIMRALPNMTVLVPVDGIETKKVVEAAIAHHGPVYIRILRNDVPDLTDPKAEFKIGVPSVLREGTDVVIFAHGFMVSKALSAADMLAKKGISARVVNVSTLKPVNDDLIRGLAKGFKGVVTAEEHNIIGGLTCAIAFALRGNGVPMECIAVQDKFGQSAWKWDQLLEHYGLTDTAIVNAAEKTLRK